MIDKKAVVDIGSNTIRMSLFKVDEYGFKELLNKKTTAGLVSYVKSGLLSKEGIDKLVMILNKLITTARELSFDDIYIFATASLRNIDNSDEVLNILKEQVSVPVKIISGREEAFYGYSGVKEKIDVKDGVIVDIGGGSTEITSLKKGEIVAGTSLPIGCLSIFEKYNSGLFISKKNQHRALKNIRRIIKSFNKDFLKSEAIYGVGGTIRAVSNVIMEKKGLQSNREIPAKFVFSLYEDLKKRDIKTYHRVLKIVPERVHTIFPGILILISILKLTNAKTIYVSKYGVREGVLINLLKKE